ncbi:MAG: ABC transporter permease subunit [Candidatus Bipolaricaulota bacterium]|nr:ABC transporter permease subunit [Candidatus Bipolaricaulota bacterium]
MAKPRAKRALAYVTDRVRDRSFAGRIAIYIGSLALLFGLWEVASLVILKVKGVEYLPNPVKAITEMQRLGPLLFRNFWTSAWRLVLAILIAFSTGYPLGLLIGQERWLDRFFSPIIYIVYPIPQVAFILLLFLVFGIGNPVKVAIVAIAIFFQLLVSARGAAKEIDPEHVTSVLSAGASRFQTYRHVVIPETLPSILTSLRVSVGLGMAFLYIAEISGSVSPGRGGLGAFIKASSFNTTQQAAGILAMALLGLLLYVIIDIIERVACRWRYTARRSS